MNKTRTRFYSLRCMVLGFGAFLVFLTGESRDVHATGNAQAAYEAGRSARDGDTRRNHYLKGMEEAQARLKQNADDPEGLFWLAVNMGAEALERGKLAALPVVPKMEQLLLRLDRVAPRYEEAGAARVLGRLYHKAPAVISVGSTKEARRFLTKAIDLAPTHPGNLAFAADFLASQGEGELARAYASRCLALLSRRSYGSEAVEWRALAEQVLEDTP